MNRIDHPIPLRDPGDLVAAIPPILGFHPDNSLVLITLRGPTLDLGPCVRADLVPATDTQALAEYLSRWLAQYEIAAVIIAVVGGSPTTRLDSVPHVDLVRCLTDTFTNEGILVACRVWASSTSHGAPWRSYDNDQTGTVPDPSSTPVAVMTVLAGEVTFDSRDDLAAMLTPDVEPSVLERRAHALGDEVERLANQDITARAGFAAVRRAIQRATTGHQPDTDEEVDRLAIALSDPRVTDASMALCLGNQADAAEQVWLALVRGVPAPYRAEPAVLLAISAQLRGHGAFAHIALDNAEAAAPDHQFAQLLRSALVAGISPADLAALITDGTARNPLLCHGLMEMS